MIENKTIVLTGASSGIGYEVLKLLMKGQGNNILAVARHVENLGGYQNVTPFACDVSTQEGVDAIFAKAESLFGKIDLFYANAGYPYYEEFNYTDWERVKAMFDTNTLSPIYTYAKYLKHLNGRDGILAYTVSAIGEMAMPGYAIYSSSKFALNGFQQAIRLEKPKNLQITCLYPVATDTNFFKVANKLKFEKPFPVQKPSVVARKMVEGIEAGVETVSPCTLFGVSKVLMGVVPPVRTLYWNIETAKLERFKQKVKAENAKLKQNVRAAIETGMEKGGELVEKGRDMRDDMLERSRDMREDLKERSDDLIEKGKIIRLDLIEKGKDVRDDIKDKFNGV